jgi:hypothetical protein
MVDFPNLPWYFWAASIEGISLLPTLLFILGAYSIYALCAVWSRCSKRRLRSVRQEPRSSRVLLGGGVIALVCLIWLAVRLVPPSSHQGLHLSGVLGAAEPGVVMARAELTPDKLPVGNASPGDHPAYALLHPETPPMLMPEKPSSAPSPPRKPKVKRTVNGEAHKKLVSNKPAGKEKPTGKVRSKKRRPKNATPNLMRHAYSTVVR